MIVAYDGTDFFGFQRQPDRRTVQGVFEVNPVARRDGIRMSVFVRGTCLNRALPIEVGSELRDVRLTKCRQLRLRHRRGVH